MNKMPDIYYIKNWRELYCIKENGTPEEYKLETKNGTIIYPYIKRKVEYIIDEKTYYDIITPYGFNGPMIIEVTGNKSKLIEEFEKQFNKYCIENNIIAEYIRFSPWLKNYMDFSKYYNLKLNNKTIAIDLTVNDILMDEICSKRRNSIRTAIKNNVEIKFDHIGETIDDFLRLYENTISKNDIGEYYWLDKDFLTKHFELLKDHIFIANAIYENNVISSSVFVYCGKQLHYLYSANDYNYNKYNGNSLILYEVALWGKENGCEFLHLGGASKSENLMSFKESFTKSNGFEYYIGTKIQQEDIYNKIVEISNKKGNSYFPEYRGE